MKTVFIYADVLACETATEESYLEHFAGTPLAAADSEDLRVVVFPVEPSDIDLSEYHFQVVDHAHEFGSAEVYNYKLSAQVYADISKALLEHCNEIILH